MRNQQPVSSAAPEPAVSRCFQSTTSAGLIGAEPEPVSRLIGGLGHELGHAFGLPHPPGCDAGSPACPTQALMWLGYITYPNAFLLPEDKSTLLASQFIAPPPNISAGAGDRISTDLRVSSESLYGAFDAVRARRINSDRSSPPDRGADVKPGFTSSTRVPSC